MSIKGFIYYYYYCHYHYYYCYWIRLSMICQWQVINNKYSPKPT